MRAHLRTHTGLKEFACSLCEAKLSTRGSLRRHVQLVHPGVLVIGTGTAGECTAGGIGVGESGIGCATSAASSSGSGGAGGAAGVTLTGATGFGASVFGLSAGVLAGDAGMEHSASMQIHMKPFVCPIQQCGKQFKTYSDCKRHCKRHLQKKQTDRFSRYL